MSDLVLAISPSELKQIKSCSSSRDIWLKFQEIYQSKGPARKASLLKQLILHKMAEDDDMKDHVRTFFDLVDKLNEMELEVPADLFTIILLYSIPESFENFRIAIESRDELPTPEELKIKLLEESEARKSRNPSIANALLVKRKKSKQIH